MRLSNVFPRRGAGLYLHVPFCSAICPYCDFAVTRDAPALRRIYLDALEREIDLWSFRLNESATGGDAADFDTVYLGGGTPSALPLEQLAEVFSWLTSKLPVSESATWSLEVNPEDVDVVSLRGWQELGVDFLSLGVQSLRPEGLKQLGRRHSASQARIAIELAVAASFETVSVDLIYCREGQSQDDWLFELSEVVAMGPTHLSCYELTYHEGTPFGRGVENGALRPMPENTRAGLFELTHRHLDELGFEGYEVSSFARPGSRSPHNQKYWQHLPYLGIGPSSHSFDGRERWWNHRGLTEWARALRDGQSPIESRELLGRDELQLEALMFALRKLEGTELAELETRYGLRREGLMARALPLVTEGLIDPCLSASSAPRLAATLAGRAVAESLAVHLSLA